MTNEMFRTIRLYLDMTQVQFAKLLCISPSTVGMIETGNRVITPRVRAKIASRIELNDDFYLFREKMSKIS